MAVLLRPWSIDDAPALLAARQSTPDLDTQLPADLTDEDAARRHIGSWPSSGAHARIWAIVEDGLTVGNVGLSAIESRHGTAWASYWLAGDARGRGLATRGLAAVARWAFGAGLHRLELGHRVNNPASCRVATGAGFVAEGIERQKLRYGAERFDVETHARLASDPVPDVAAVELHGDPLRIDGAP
ncbi:GNAT family N-acetyltransferase [Curtobacterium sp. B18]|uniref:GNAT family N-acetyltransferase n=1 Tax=Curtobacterium sp. B18 TaxID=95614 RepID=UPI00034932C8|nr:GNAT family N-acetyltransferase [Curtobacterium sp. B18]